MKAITLKNGINILFVNKNTQDLVVVGLVCKAGYTGEYGVYPNGTASVVERLFLAGTYKNPNQRKLWQAIEEIGAKVETSTDAETTTFYLLVPKENQYKALSLLTEIIQKSLFEEKELERIKHEIVDEIKESRRAVSVNFGLENIYTCFSYSQNKFGTIDQVMAVDKGIVFDFLARKYRPSNCYIVVSGAYQQKPMQELIEQEWGYWVPTVRSDQDDYFNYEVCKKDLPKVPFLQSAKGNTDVNISFLLPEGIMPKDFSNEKLEIDDDYMPIVWDNYLERYVIYLILNEVLIGGNSGKLWLTGVVEEKILNHVQSQVIMFLNSGCFSIYANIDNANFMQGLELILESVSVLKNDILSPSDLLKAKEMTKINLLMLKADLEKYTKFCVNNFILSGVCFDISDIVTKINYVEGIQVKTQAMDIFTPSNFCLSLIGTNKENKIIERLMDRYL